ncbi:hypothetical protein CPU12_07315 [Malaciobacter molluscorum LMG 25693]|uniref:Sensory/regulatory protein RpfC n=1 Tax=Malaciobacter molluscorum LMG 25693 TaxID=870501 RepID=A0A2G1DHV3_9BACT|nr:transporter substrate-binding domain-containing protein [Malaciobacter molluscorum]AXX93010.1 BvgS-like domain-containing two-component system sensor histidine kinase/response regulator fusion protein [Malaciobacter molluscorum LMG 25693]PHO18067.1 hypothetical protein CPU12_07315 [Malaciobacter molluscorum LMG 25693]
MKSFSLFLFFVYFSISLNASLLLTNKEKEWISKNPIVKVGVDNNWAPFEFKNKQNIQSGISSDYLKEISKITGLKFDIYSDKWSNVLQKIRLKKIDMLACADNTEDRSMYLDFTEPYLLADIVVVSRKDLKINNLQEIKDLTIALPEANYIHERLKKRFPNLKFIFTKSNEEAINYVSYNRADIYIGNMPVISYYINKHMLTNLEVKFKADFDNARLSMAVIKDKQILFSIIQKALMHISKERRKQINKKWIFDSTNIKLYNSKNLFTQEELDWLKKNSPIKIAGDGHWHPFSYYDKNGNYVGIIPDLFKSINQNSQIDFKLIKTKNWLETLEQMKVKKIDVIDAISYSASRAKYMNFTTSYFTNDFVIIGTNTNNKYIKSIDSIVNKKIIGTVDNYIISEKIKKDYTNIEKLREFGSIKDGLQSLASRQIDYFITDIPSFDYYSKKLGLSNLKIVGPSGYSFSYSFGVRKDDKILLSIMNKLLNNISKEEFDRVYRKWIQVEYQEKIDYTLIWKILIFSIIIISVIFYSNTKLKNQIEQTQKAKDELKKSNEFIHSIMDSQMDIIVVTNGKEIQRVNKAFLDYFKFDSLNDFKKIYNCISDLFYKGDENSEFISSYKDNKLWIDYIIDNSANYNKVKIILNEKEYIFKVLASPIENSVDLKTAVFHDITAIEKLHNELIEAKNRALEATKHKTEFLANMSHEIRTPMNSVIGFTELLEKEITNPIQKDYLSSIKKGGNALIAIINDILDLSKIEAGKMQIKYESINPKELILEVESIFHSKLISKNIDFSVHIDSTIPKYIIIDGIRLRQVLFNLIGNAIKFTEQGYIKLNVKNIFKDGIKSKIDLVFEIIDSGVGIDEKDLKNIFNVFEQSEQDRAKYGGTGLGLAICSKLVEMMNGKIEVSSKKAIGSTFRVKLYDIDVGSVDEKDYNDKINYESIIFEKASILIVDDVDENRKLIKSILNSHNFDLYLANNGKMALEIINKHKIDLILMDLRMPIMNGYEATTLLKSNKKTSSIPIIALTASVMGKDLQKVESYGFNGYLRKPIIINDLLSELSKFLEFKFDTNTIEKLCKDDKFISNEKLIILIRKLEELEIKLNSIKSKGDFILIESFCDDLINLNIDFELIVINEYTNELKKYIDSFDIEKVDYLLNNYSNVIENIKNKMESQNG